MALIKDPQKRARDTKTELQAARLKEELEVELALNDQLPAGWEQQADAALEILNERWADLDSYSPDDLGGNGNWQPSYSRGASEGLARRHQPATQRQQIRQDQHAAEHGDRNAAARVHQAGRPHIAAARRRGRGSVRLGRRTRAAIRTATPAAVGDWTSLTLGGIGAAIALSIAYLLLRSADHSSSGGAIGYVARGLAFGVTRLFSPYYDVFPSGAGHGFNQPTPTAANDPTFGRNPWGGPQDMVPGVPSGSPLGTRPRPPAVSTTNKRRSP